MQKELLVPVGSLEILKYAICGGANAVYLGGQKFGARAYAKNFSESEIIKAREYCHLYGVKIYVTVNTMIFESAFTSATEYIDFLYNAHVDALIVSDLGLISYIHENYHDLEIHASTQAHTFNQDEISFLKTLGVKRVVLDREMSLEEIENIKDIEKEVFIHGALCACYSGQCLISALHKKRSGNLGSCEGSCRMPYKLYRHNKQTNDDVAYPLSTKELNTSTSFAKLLKSDITSFKIEGRMKSKEYVYYVTHLYKRLMEEYSKYKTCTVTNEDTKTLECLFYRGFTNGYLFNEKNIYEPKTSNHQGSFLGEVVSIRKDRLGIKLASDLYQGDAIRFTFDNTGMYVNYLYDAKDNLISHGVKGSIVYVKNSNNKLINSSVRKTVNSVLLKNLNNITEPKIKITMSFTCTMSVISLTISDFKNNITVKYSGAEPATNKKTTKEEIESKLLKLGNTPFICENITINIIGDLFIPISKVNNLRREAITKLIERRSK